MYFEAGDGYTYSCMNHIPFEYDSLEQAYIDFEQLVLKNTKPFSFCGFSFDPSIFKTNGEYFPPEFLELEDWFNTYKTTGN